MKIVRDGYGVPAVTGDTEDVMWWGAGYAMAQDRLFELELFRRATTGRLAEIAGRERVPDDEVVRRRDYFTPAELDAQFAALPAAFRSRFDAYRDGINAWIDHVQSSPSDMPGEFAAVGITVPDPWTVRDSVAIGVYLARTIPLNSDPDGPGAGEPARAASSRARRRSTGLVPLRTPGALTTIPAREGKLPLPAGSHAARRSAPPSRRSVAFARGLPFAHRSARGPDGAARPLAGGAPVGARRVVHVRGARRPGAPRAALQRPAARVHRPPSGSSSSSCTRPAFDAARRHRARARR